MLYIFSDSKVKFCVSNSIEVKRLPIKSLSKHKPSYKDLIYVDISALTKASQTRVIKKLQTISKKTYCGIIDPKNDIKDPSTIFFRGLHDYIGKNLYKEKINEKRIKAVKDFADSAKICPIAKAKAPKTSSASNFPGWDKIRKGVVYKFCFFYVRIESDVDMKTRLGNNGYRKCIDRLNQTLQQYFIEAKPHLWVETESGIIYLLSPKKENMQKAVQSALRMLASAPIISYEKLKLPFSANFVFAMHVGASEYAPKGSTGKIISESLNFIYHLGTNKSNRGRITVSQETYDIFQTASLNDLFVTHGNFEGHSLLHSKRFSSSKKCKN